MVQRISSLSWVPMGANNSKRVAFVSLNFATDANYEIQLQGTATGNPNADNVVPNWLQIDNLANNALINVTFGGVIFQVQPFSRQNFPIDGTMQSAVISIPAGVAALWLSEQRLADDASNSVAAGAAANAALLAAINANTVAVNAGTVATNNMNVDLQNAITGMTNSINASIATLLAATNNLLAATNTLISITQAAKPFILVAAARAQVLGDNLKSLLCTFNGAYTLLSAVTVGAGFTLDISNEGSGNVTVTPLAGQTINGVFTNGAPMVMRPDSTGTLTSDGANWVFKGSLFFTHDTAFTGVLTGTNNKSATAAHGLGKVPTIVDRYFYWTGTGIANDGVYGPGAIVPESRVDKFVAAAGAATASSYTVAVTNVNVTSTFSYVAITTHNISNVAGLAAGQTMDTAAGGSDWLMRTKLRADW